jgi:hypothetical protein
MPIVAFRGDQASGNPAATAAGARARLVRVVKLVVHETRDDGRLADALRSRQAEAKL